VTILGMTFKENVPDIRNSKAVDVARELGHVGVAVQIHDPLALPEETLHEYGLALTPFDQLQPADAVILAVSHGDYLSKGWPLIAGLLKDGSGVVIDVKSKLDRSQKPSGVELWRL
jgi:UDP-N-acetyl-D-galactosamine dehydrogenase